MSNFSQNLLEMIRSQPYLIREVSFSEINKELT